MGLTGGRTARTPELYMAVMILAPHKSLFAIGMLLALALALGFAPFQVQAAAQQSRHNLMRELVEGHAIQPHHYVDFFVHPRTRALLDIRERLQQARDMGYSDGARALVLAAAAKGHVLTGSERLEAANLVVEEEYDSAEEVDVEDEDFGLLSSRMTARPSAPELQT